MTTLPTEDNASDDAAASKLPEDNAPAFSLPDDTDNSPASNLGATPPLPDTHPATDSATNIDAHEAYDVGMAGAAEAEEPKGADTVVSYNPDQSTNTNGNEMPNQEKVI